MKQTVKIKICNIFSFTADAPNEFLKKSYSF